MKAISGVTDPEELVDDAGLVLAAQQVVGGAEEPDPAVRAEGRRAGPGREQCLRVQVEQAGELGDDEVRLVDQVDVTMAVHLALWS